MYSYISKSMRYTKHESGIQPTLLHYIACSLAVALVCCSLLCIFLYTTSAFASSEFLSANGKTMSGQVVLDDTETDTPSQTATSIPSPTVTTSTPNPSPSATRAITPSPTSTSLAPPTATVQHSSIVTGTQTPSSGATPTSTMSISATTQGTGANQTPATTNNMGNQSNQGIRIPDNNSPLSLLKIGMGSLALLGLLFISGRFIVNRLQPSKTSSRFAPTRTASSRKGLSNQVPPFTFQEPMTSNVLSAGMIIAPPGSYNSSSISRPGSLTPGSDPTASLHANLPVGADPSLGSSDSLYLGQRRNELLTNRNLPAFQQQPDTPSEDNTELSDAYLQSIIQLY